MIIRFKFCQKWVSFGTIIPFLPGGTQISGFKLQNRLHTVRVGVWLSLVITQDVICTHENLTSQYK